MSLFRRGPGEAEALHAIEAARGVLDLLKLTRARFGSVEPLLKEAEDQVRRGAYARAMDLAGRVERIATAIESDHRAVAEALEVLDRHMGRLQELGIPDAEDQKALVDVRARAKATRDLEGVRIPDYAGALAMATDAASRAEARIAASEKSADVLFSAELAVEGASDAEDVPPEAIEEARALLAKAKQEAQHGQYEMAATDASVAEKIALGLVDRRRRALETLESVEKLVVGLRTAGVVVEPIRGSLDIGKTLLEKGKVSAAIEVFNEAAQEAVSLGTQYREVLNAMTTASAAVDALRGEGLSVTEAEISMGRAKAALMQGNYALAAACCDDVHLAAANQRKFRDGLRTLIDETKAKVTRLRETGVAYVNDAEEMVLKAEREFANGEYEATNDDLRIATLLLGSGPNGRPRGEPAPP